MNGDGTPESRRTSDHRTIVHIDRVIPQGAICTPAGISLPVESTFVPRANFPDGMWAEATTGRVFFAYVNLAATRPEDVDLERIEREWGVTEWPPLDA